MKNLRRLYRLTNYERVKGFVKDIKRFRDLLKALGNPHLELNTPILVAGTKGKGSVVHIVSRSLQNSGFKVGMNTSPHLVSLDERIRVNGKPIPLDRLEDLLGAVFRAVDRGYGTTFFESITAAAFLHFLNERTDYEVFEVGLGGRLDATNVVEQKVSVITRIGYDHTNILGNTLEEIAGEKAGIIKNDSPVITTFRNEEVLHVIERRAKEYGAEVVVVGYRVLDVGEEGTVFETDGKVLKVPLLGEFQAENGALSYHVMKVLGLSFKPEGVFVPGRMHVLRRSPLLLIDGAHNPTAAESLVRSLKRIFPGRRFNFVLAFSRGKDYVQFLRYIRDLADWIFITRYPWRRSEQVEEVLKRALTLHGKCAALSSVYEIENVLTEDTVITGSLYLLGEFLRLWGVRYA